MGLRTLRKKHKKTVESYFLIFNYSSNKMGLTGTNGTQKCKNQIIWLYNDL